MEKLGVETEKTKEDLEKEAGDSNVCPQCGRELPNNTNVPYCIACGTEPFEKKEE